jgi:hypothetical protein
LDWAEMPKRPDFWTPQPHISPSTGTTAPHTTHRKLSAGYGLRVPGFVDGSIVAVVTASAFPLLTCYGDAKAGGGGAPLDALYAVGAL